MWNDRKTSSEAGSSFIGPKEEEILVDHVADGINRNRILNWRRTRIKMRNNASDGP
jgi:hypothetical protein